MSVDMGSITQEVTMSFRLEGTYVENCNCDVICPCTWSGMARVVGITEVSPDSITEIPHS